MLQTSKYFDIRLIWFSWPQLMDLFNYSIKADTLIQIQLRICTITQMADFNRLCKIPMQIPKLLARQAL